MAGKIASPIRIQILSFPLDHENEGSIANPLLGQSCFHGRANGPKASPREAPELTPFNGPLGNPVQHNAGGRYESSAMFERIALGPRPLGPKNRESPPETPSSPVYRALAARAFMEGVEAGIDQASVASKALSVRDSSIHPPPSTRVPW